jgi:streptogramin lyase
VWFIPQDGTSASVIDVSSGAVTTYNALPASESSCTNQFGLKEEGITPGPNGALWISVFCGEPMQFGFWGFNVLSTNGAVSANVIAQYDPLVIASATIAGDGNMWSDTLDPSNEAAVVEFPANLGPPSQTCSIGLSAEFAIVSGPDGALWLPSNNGSNGQLVRVTTGCAMSTVATVSGTSFDVNTIVSAGDSLWVLDRSRGSVSRFSTGGAATNYTIPNAFGGSGYLASSATSNYLYFSDTKNGEIGRINVTTGAIQEFSVQNSGVVFHPSDMALDAAGNVWTHDGSTILKISISS